MGVRLICLGSSSQSFTSLLAKSLKPSLLRFEATPWPGTHSEDANTAWVNGLAEDMPCFVAASRKISLLSLLQYLLALFFVFFLLLLVSSHKWCIYAHVVRHVALFILLLLSSSFLLLLLFMMLLLTFCGLWIVKTTPTITTTTTTTQQQQHKYNIKN